MYENIKWINKSMKIRDLRPAEYNPRKLTPKQAKDLDNSLERFNLADPIVINKDGTIIGGHKRLQILEGKYGVDHEVDVRIASRQLTPEEEKELNLRLNKNQGEWDWEKLVDFDKFMLKDVGFDSSEWRACRKIDEQREGSDGLHGSAIRGKLQGNEQSQRQGLGSDGR